MKEILRKVDFNTHAVYEIDIVICDSYLFQDIKEGDAQEDEYGQSLDAASDVRRTIKHSTPLENKKIIDSIKVEDQREDEHGNFCRNIELHYYLLVDKDENEKFSTEKLHDDLEEEWRDGSECSITITPYEC